MNLLVAMTVSATSELKEKSGIIQAEKKVKDIVKDGKILQSLHHSFILVALNWRS